MIPQEEPPHEDDEDELFVFLIQLSFQNIVYMIRLLTEIVNY